MYNTHYGPANGPFIQIGW